MTQMQATIFDVERGLCVFVRTPNNYGVMIDCGRSEAFSPARWVHDYELPTLNAWADHPLAWLIVTHPHEDHVEDIQNVTRFLSPAALLRENGFNWNAIVNPLNGSASEHVQAFYHWQQGYTAPVPNGPPLGINIQTFNLTPQEAVAIDRTPQHLINNTSFVTILTYPTSHGIWKMVVAGDTEVKGWEELLKRLDFRSAISGTHFFVTAHHGHESGFCSQLYDFMGKPLVNITSEKSNDESVSSSYSSPNYATGIEHDGETRLHLTTRTDGTIRITMRENWIYDTESARLSDNEGWLSLMRS